MLNILFRDGSMVLRIPERTRSKLAWALSALLVACGSDTIEAVSYDGILTAEPWTLERDGSSASSPEGGVERTDASEPARDAANTVATDAQTDAGSPDSSTPELAPTNTPWAPLVYVGSASSYGLVLRASNLLQSPSADQVYARWLMTVENEGTQPICSVLVYATFLDADDRPLLEFTATTEAVTYNAGTYDLDCIPAGGTAPGWSNDFLPSAVPLDQVDRIEYRFGGSVGSGDLTLVSGPTVTNFVINPAFGRRIASGRITNGRDVVRYPGIIVYPIDQRGMPLDRISDTGPATLAAYGTWDFETLESDVAIDTYLRVVRFSR